MTLKRRLKKVVVFSLSVCILLFCLGVAISRGLETYVYLFLERPVSDRNMPMMAMLPRQTSIIGNRHVMAKLQGQASTATTAQPEPIRSRPVMAKLQGQTSTTTNSKSEYIDNRHKMIMLQEQTSTEPNAKPEFIVNRQVMTKLHGQTSTATNAKPEFIGRDKIKTLVWYDTGNTSILHLSTKVGFSQCKYTNCQYKKNLTKTDTHPSEPFDADVVLIQAWDIYRLSPPPRRDENQAFVLAVRDSFFCIEKKLRSNKWLDMFNWTMTYRLDSDFVFKYANILERENKTDLLYKNYDKIFEEKNDKAVWFVSHCKTKSRREHYVREMQNVMEIDIFGECGRDTPQLCPKKSRHAEECHEQTTKKYKFYLAFENTFVEDYVTEKVFHWFNRDIIVVVRGGANYSRILPSGSVVDAGDFETLKN